jgi:large subunit ribosomal protein L3
MNLQGLIGKKTYQTQGFLQNGTRVPLSAVSVSDNFISQVKTTDKDGYNSIQIGFDMKKKPNKALTGHGKKAGLDKTPRFLKEIRVDDVTGLELGTKIDTNAVFKPGDIVDVSGVSKGKGFAGGVKRWHFKGGPRTHGQSDRERAPGSIGQTTTPGRVYKGKKMAGKMGDTTATTRNLEVIEITADGVILIKGLIPGPKGAIVVIKKVGENKKFVPLYKEPSSAEATEGRGVVEEQKESASSSSVSEDAKPALEENAESEPASLSESQPTISDETQEVQSEAALSSSEDEQAPVATEPENPEVSSEPAVSSPVNEPSAASEEQKSEQKKEEVKENANS